MGLLEFGDSHKDIFLHISSFLDLASLLELSRASAGMRRLMDGLGVLPFDGAPDLVAKYVGSSSGVDADDVFASEEFNIAVTRRLHRAIQTVLDVVNSGEGRALSIVTGEDLLRSVGRLSMMIADCDYLPFSDSSPLPVNWTSEGFMLARRSEDRPDFTLGHISDTLARLRSFGRRPEHYRHPGYEAFVKDRVKKPQPGADAVRTLLVDKIAPALLPYLDSSSTLNLSLVNKSFLLLVGTCPMAPGFNHEDPRAAVLFDVMFRAAQALRAGEYRPLSVDFWSRAKSSATQIPSELLEAFAKQVETLSSKFPFTMDLPYGLNRHVGLVNTGAVRLIFSQGVEILQEINPGAKKDDLSYENIVKYLKTLDAAQLRIELARVFRRLEHARPFIGELAILLIGIEGSQNNLMVLHAPMVLDLVSAGEITWSQALFTGQRKPTLDCMPWFAYASDQTQKGGPGVMERQGLVLKSGFDQTLYDVAKSSKGKKKNLTDQEKRAQGYDIFREVFMRREFLLQERWLRRFVPDLFRRKYVSADALLDLIESVAVRYLQFKFDPQGATRTPGSSNSSGRGGDDRSGSRGGRGDEGRFDGRDGGSGPGSSNGSGARSARVHAPPVLEVGRRVRVDYHLHYDVVGTIQSIGQYVAVLVQHCYVPNTTTPIETAHTHIVLNKVVEWEPGQILCNED